MAAFAVGDRVAWDHLYSTDHAAGSIIREEAVKAKAPSAKLGTVLKVANESGTHLEVQLDDESDSVVLTEDELVRVG